jgi:hypothetical protein
MLLHLTVSQHVSAIAIAGICLKDSYVYITQQDAPHKDKKQVVGDDENGTQCRGGARELEKKALG